jgi:hypothetical protein
VGRYNELYHGVLFEMVVLTYTLLCVRVKPYNYARTSLDSVVLSVGLMWYGFISQLSLFLDFSGASKTLVIILVIGL